MNRLRLIFLFFSLTVFTLLVNAQAWVQTGQTLNNEDTGGKSGYSVSLNSDGSTVAVGAPWNDEAGQHLGDVRIYQNSDGVWTRIGEKINGERDNANFGYSVSLSSNGTIVAVGAPHYYKDGIGSIGHVKIYQNINNEWIQLGNSIEGTNNSEFGFAVSLSSDSLVVAIGAPGYNYDRGIVEIYKYNTNNNTWIKTGNGIVGEGDWDKCGWSVSLNSDGTIAAIGAIYNNSDGKTAGHVRVYAFKDDAWTQLGDELKGEISNGEFGFSIDLNSDGSVVATGTPKQTGDITGIAKVYRFNKENTWSQIGDDFIGTEPYESLGQSVSLNSDGSVIAIGSMGANGLFGGVKIYKNIEDTWTLLGSSISGEAHDDIFGFSVSLSSDGMIVACGAVNSGTCGQLRVFTFSEDATRVQNLKSNTVSVYPNPTTGITKLNFADLNVLRIKISSLTGKTIIEKTGIQKSTTIDLSTYTNGIYIVSILTDNKTLVKKIVKK